MPHNPWPSIENFHNFEKDNPGLVAYGPWAAKVKLHGTNAAVRIEPDGTVVAQSRNRDLTTTDDNCGFAAFVERTADLWREAVDTWGGTRTYFGEWIGPGIQKGVAASAIPRRTFCIFAERIDGVNRGIWYIEPRFIHVDLPEIPDVQVIPYYAGATTGVTAEDINDAVAAVEAEDPYIKDVFGVSGIGEGLVYYCTDRNAWGDAPVMFKAKGAEHRVVAARTPTAPPENASDVQAFVATYVTEARLEQIAFEVNQTPAPYDIRRTGDFLKSFNADVLKEADLGTLTWKDVGGAVNREAARWYKARAL